MDNPNNIVQRKNWSKIANERDELLRLLLSDCKDTGTLERVELVRPDYFQSEPGEKPFVPVSKIKAAAYQISLSEGYSAATAEQDEELYWKPVLADFNIPIAYDFDQNSGENVPDTIADQFNGQKCDASIRIYLRGKEYVVVSLDSGFIERHGLHSEMQHVSAYDFDELSLADASFFNFDE